MASYSWQLSLSTDATMVTLPAHRPVRHSADSLRQRHSGGAIRHISMAAGNDSLFEEDFKAAGNDFLGQFVRRRDALCTAARAARPQQLKRLSVALLSSDARNHED